MVSAEDGIKCRLSGTCLLHNHQFPIHPELLHLTDPLLPDSKGPRTVEPVSTQLFADESKRRGFVMAAVEADSASVAHHRKVLRQQLLRGQERLHFTGESKTRRDQIWKNIAAWKSPVTVHIIVANHRYMAEARAQWGRFRKRIAEYGKPFSKLSKLIARARDREDRFENGFRECTRFGDASPHELVLGLLVDPRLRERAPTRGHRYACRWPHSQFMRRKQRRWQRVEARLRWISRRFLGQRALNVRCIPFSEATPQCVTGVTKLAAALATSLVVIERDAGREISDRKAPSDRRALTEGLHDTGISWDIREPRTEPMLWVADAAAWLWTHPDAAWRARVTPLVGQIIRL